MRICKPTTAIHHEYVTLQKTLHHWTGNLTPHTTEFKLKTKRGSPNALQPQRS